MIMSERTMEGKVAIVTGGSSGIGLATAKEFARRGAHVVVSDVADEAGKKAVSEIEAEGGSAIYVNADVSNSEQVKALVEKTVETFGRLDYGVNNAGIGGPALFTADYEEADWNRVIDIN